MSTKNYKIIIIVLVVAGLLALGYFYLFRSSVELLPEDPEAVTTINGKKYKDLPKKVRLNPGEYLFVTKKKGFADHREVVVLKSFSKKKYSPALKELSTVNFIEAQNYISPVLTDFNSKIVYFHRKDLKFKTLPVYFISGYNFDGNEEEASTKIPEISNNGKISLDWSPDRQKSIIRNDSKDTIYNLVTGEIIKIPAEKKGTSFYNDDTLVFSSKNADGKFDIFVSDLKLDNPKKLITAKEEAKQIIISPDKNILAIATESALQIYDIKTGKQVYEKTSQIGRISWLDSSTIVFNSTSEDDSKLFLYNFVSKSDTEISVNATDDFVWKDKNTLVYVDFDKINAYIKKFDLTSEQSSIIATFSKSAIPANLMLSGRDAIFQMENTVYSIRID